MFSSNLWRHITFKSTFAAKLDVLLDHSNIHRSTIDVFFDLNFDIILYPFFPKQRLRYGVLTYSEGRNVDAHLGPVMATLRDYAQGA